MCSSHQISLLCSSLSRSLRRDWAKEIGRNLSGRSFGIKKTRNSFHAFENSPKERISLKVVSRASCMMSGRLERIRLSILSKPGADLDLARHLERAASSSVLVKGLEKRDNVSGVGLKEEGKLGNKHEGGQIVGISSRWIFTVRRLEGAASAAKALCLNLFTVFQRTEVEVNGFRLAQNSLNEASLFF